MVMTRRSKRRIQKPAPYIPQDVTIEILCRLPVKSLLRYKCVSKLWCALINDPLFAKHHLIQSRNNHSDLNILLHSKNTWYLASCSKLPEIDSCIPMDLLFRHQECRIYGSCDGLLCVGFDKFKDTDPHQPLFWLYNPCTGRNKRLPPPIRASAPYYPSSRPVCGFGYNATSRDYEVVTIWKFKHREQHKFELVTQCQVYSLSKNSWRRIEAIPQTFQPEEPLHNIGKLVNGAFHWVNSNQTITAFHFATETFSEFPTTYIGICFDRKFAKVVEFTDCDGLICYDDARKLEGWIMEDYGVTELRSKYNIYSCDPIKYLGGKNFKNFMGQTSRIIICDDGKLLSLRKSFNPPKLTFVTSFTASLLAPDSYMP